MRIFHLKFETSIRLKLWGGQAYVNIFASKQSQNLSSLIEYKFFKKLEEMQKWQKIILNCPYVW